MPKIFISHSWEDNEVSKKLAECLERDGAEVWVDYKRLSGGDSLPVTIGEGIEWCDTMALIWSKSATESYYVRLEWTTALNNEKRIVACVIDNTKLPTILTGFLYIDLKSFEAGYQRLARDLKLIPPSKTSPKVRLRSGPREDLSKDEIERMLRRMDFYSGGFWSYIFFGPKNRQGKGLNNQYKVIEKKGEKLVIDHTTGLTWQQSGSSDTMQYDEAKEYIKQLNADRFAGYDDWRLPTLEEAMSLMEPKKKNGDLHISEVFDKTQRYIWTADKRDSSAAWVVLFYNGSCYSFHVVRSNDHVRAVR